MTIFIYTVLSCTIIHCAMSKLLRKHNIHDNLHEEKIETKRKLEDMDLFIENTTIIHRMHNFSINDYNTKITQNTMSCTADQIPKDKSTCWQWNVENIKYDYNKLQKGCDHKKCQDAVCGCDPYCCNVSWDLSCRGFQATSNNDGNDNFYVNGCSASMLCCEPNTAYPKPPLPSNPIPKRDTNPTQYYKCEIENWTPPNNSSCWKWNVVQENTASSIINNDLQLQKGCDCKKCQDAVCECDEYCCDVSWDLSCRGVKAKKDGDQDNFFNPGCSASLLCCEGDGAFPKPPLPPV